MESAPTRRAQTTHQLKVGQTDSEFMEGNGKGQAALRQNLGGPQAEDDLSAVDGWGSDAIRMRRVAASMAGRGRGRVCAARQVARPYRDGPTRSRYGFSPRMEAVEAVPRQRRVANGRRPPPPPGGALSFEKMLRRRGGLRL